MAMNETIDGARKTASASSPAVAAAPSFLRRLFVGHSLNHTARRTIFIALFCIVLFTYVLLPVQLNGPSMEPNYKDGSWLLVDANAFWRKAPKLGDVVAIRLAGKSVLFLKRVVGLPGDKIAWKDGKLHRNGTEIEEPYVKFPCQWQREEVTVGATELFVVGDNRQGPMRNHSHGLVSQGRVVGGALW